MKTHPYKTVVLVVLAIAGVLWIAFIPVRVRGALLLRFQMPYNSLLQLTDATSIQTAYIQFIQATSTATTTPGMWSVFRIHR